MDNNRDRIFIRDVKAMICKNFHPVSHVEHIEDQITAAAKGLYDDGKLDHKQTANKLRQKVKEIK